MNFHILNSKTNKPIFSAKLQHFSVHTAAMESHNSRIKHGDTKQIGCADVVYNVYLKDGTVKDQEMLEEFEAIHRLDHTDKFSGNKEQSSRDFYVFIQPKLRDLYSWNITETNY